MCLIHWACPHTGGLWQSLVAEDWDKDGDVDLVAGNWGTNSVLQPPLRLFVHDFDLDTRTDPIIATRKGNTWYSWAPRDILLRQLPSLAESSQLTCPMPTSLSRTCLQQMC